MGVYDTLPNGEQVKCWGCEGETYYVDNWVGFLDGCADYIVLLVEGGYVRVENGDIKEYISEVGKEKEARHLYWPEDFPNEVCFDKWGGPVNTKEDLEHASIMGSHYYWWLDKEGRIENENENGKSECRDDD